ncbi:MAG: DUF4199 domain-containing protein [Lewinellaceae bacterium]|nr:DUF4199 domain-containing protein [Lewinella sp.]MCB9278277.1 DUF4199 domain-containing protein [Lewinellaceae bacterium]
MEPLDSSRIQPDAPFFPAAMRWGLIGGLISVIYFLLGNTLGFGRPSAGIAMIAVNFVVSLAISVIVAVMAIKAYRDKDLGGYINFGKAFLTGFVALLISGVIGIIFSYIYMNFIEPDYAQNVMRESMEMMEDFGVQMDDAQMEEAMQRGGNPGSIMSMLFGFLGSAFFSAIISLIVGAVMKKDPAANV